MLGEVAAHGHAHKHPLEEGPRPTGAAATRLGAAAASALVH